MDAAEFREVGHRVVDLLAEYLENIEEKPVFPDVEPATLDQAFCRAAAPGSQHRGKCPE